MRKWCPQAGIVYHPFHIISSYGREVVDKVRVAEAKKGQGKHKDAYKGTRCVPLSGPEDLLGRQHEKLSEPLSMGNRLFAFYPLRDGLKRLRRCRSPHWGERFLRGWHLRAVCSEIEPLKKFAGMLKRRLPGILAHCRYPIHAGVLEGTDNKVKVIKRAAYG